MTPDQENNIVQAMTGLDWTAYPDADAIEAIRSVLGCSHQDAKGALTEICVNRDILECRSESGTHSESWPNWKTRWKWIKKAKLRHQD